MQAAGLDRACAEANLDVLLTLEARLVQAHVHRICPQLLVVGAHVPPAPERPDHEARADGLRRLLLCCSPHHAGEGCACTQHEWSGVSGRRWSVMQALVPPTSVAARRRQGWVWDWLRTHACCRWSTSRQGGGMRLGVEPSAGSGMQHGGKLQPPSITAAHAPSLAVSECRVTCGAKACCRARQAQGLAVC